MTSQASSRMKCLHAPLSLWMRRRTPQTKPVNVVSFSARALSSKAAVVQENGSTKAAKRWKGKYKEKSPSNPDDANKGSRILTLPSRKPRLANQSTESPVDASNAPAAAPAPPHYTHRARMKELFPDGWNPPRKLSRQAMEGLRALHRLDPQQLTTPVLAARFRISPEAVRRILKSRWEPNREETSKLVEREKRRRVDAMERRAERDTTVMKKMLGEGEGDRRGRWDEEDGLTFV